jgi:hypothetical protein
VATVADLARALGDLRVATGRSYDRIAADAGLSRSTVHGMCNGATLPRLGSMRAFVMACGADPAPWDLAWQRVQRNARPLAPVLPASAADVSIRLRAWVTYYYQGRYPEEILLGNVALLEHQEATNRSVRLTELPAGIGGLIRCQLQVEAVTHYREIRVPIRSTEQFWALVLADMVLHREDRGTRRWLIEQTEKILAGGSSRRGREQLRLTWRMLFDVFQRTGPAAEAPWPLPALIHDVVQVTKGRPERFSAVMRWLLQVFDADADVRSGLRGALAAYERSKAVLERPPMRAAVMELQQRTSAGPGAAVHAPATLEPLKLGGYEFEAMCLPLTRADVDVLHGRQPPGGPEGDLPYLVELPDHAPDGALQHLLLDLIGRLRIATRSAADEQWAVPTVPEWLLLAGCQDEAGRYPWGPEPPTPRRANLRYPAAGLAAVLQPVRLHDAGAARTGAWDCCGNVHEIVEWRPGGFMRPDFRLSDLRLAGGSFRDLAANVSCRRFRRFVPAPGAPRGNVGLRLVKYRAEDAHRRRAALKRYHQKLQPE